MSVIYGIISLKEMPVQQADLEKMKKAMDFWGPDGQGMWIESSAGLGNLLLYNTPESVFEKMPFCDPTGNLIFTASARIDNRSELCRLFRITPQEAMKLPDSYFIMRAYQRWGEDCPDHLLGDWSFAVWDKQKQRLFIARDHHGVTALYYHLAKDFFVFSSSLKGILCLKEIEKKVNEYKVSQILVGWNEGGPETCYQNIFRLPPAHTLTLENNKLVTNRYWFLEHTPELRLEREQHYIDLFLDIYTEAVKCRLRSYGPVGATLSGGLDSGSVCTLASKELKKKGKRLQAFTAVPLYDTTGLVPPNRIGDEGPLAQAVADHCGNIDITFCKAEDINPLEELERMVEIQDEPFHSASNAYWISDLTKNAKEKNLKTILIGQGGNLTVSWMRTPKSLVQMIKNQVKNLMREKNRNTVYLKNNKKVKIPDFFKQLDFRISVLSKGLMTYAFWSSLGLSEKICFVDPTIDKRLIELTLNSRCNYRKVIISLLPNSINYEKIKCVQAADLHFRLKQTYIVKKQNNWKNPINLERLAYDYNRASINESKFLRILFINNLLNQYYEKEMV